MAGLLQDIRFGVRQLRKNCGYSCTAILILAIGIGATSAIFSVLNPILFEPLPYPHSQQIVSLWYSGAGGVRVPQAFHTYRELAERNHSLQALAVMKSWQATLSGTGQPERVEGQRVSAAYFRVLGIAPALGRDFVPTDDVPNGPKVVILSHGLWQRRFGGDRTIVGQDVRMDDDLYKVIGIMPAAFENVLASSAEVWSPLQYDASNVASSEGREWGHHLRMVGRLKDGITKQQAKADLAWISSTPVQEFPRPGFASMERGVILEPLQDDITRSVKPGLLAVFGAVVLVLVIACVNVINLVLARGVQRHKEIALRAALGAAQRRLVRQLLTESLLLAALGGALGLVVTKVGIRLLISMSPAGLPRVHAIQMQGVVFVFVVATTVLVGLAVGIIPAWTAAHRDLQTALQQGSQRTSPQQHYARRVFVVSEMALATVLLVGTGLLLHSLRRLFAVPVGFQPSNVLSMQVDTNGHRYDDDRVCHRFFRQALDSVRQVPGITAAAFTNQLPLSGDSDTYGAHFEGDNPGTAYPVYRYAVTADYFQVLEIPLLRGRLLSDHDTQGTPPVILISESLARRRFPNEDPISKRVHIGGRNGTPEFTVVGVVGDVKQMSLALNDSDAVYTTTEQWTEADRTLSLVTRGRNPLPVQAIKDAIWSQDKDQPIVRVARMESLVAESAAERRFLLIVFEVFGLVALTLAATGVYGVLSGSVTERTREIGIRSALGASRHGILRLVMRQGMMLTGLGVMIGLPAALTASQASAALLFGISTLDPITYFGVVMLLACVSVISCGVPAWRAARIDPMLALRYE